MTMDARAALSQASRFARVLIGDVELLHQGENTMYRLGNGVVARVSRPGQLAAAAKEVRVSQWLASQSFPVVRALADVAQPVEVAGRAVTFWHELPEHRYSSHVELAGVLRALHALPPPPFELPAADPFVQLDQRLHNAEGIAPDDRAWLLQRLASTKHSYGELPSGLPTSAVHGDAWAGNIVVTNAGPVMLDLERFGYGPPEWDLSGPAVDFTTFGYLESSQWHEFCGAYGYDVTEWSGFDIVRDARELRKVTFAFQLAQERPDIHEEALYRLACLRGEHGPRPWHWKGLT